MGHSQRTIMHPDENLLTAFVERTLAPVERGRVLEHLSDCANCRDAVFLAQQAAGAVDLQTMLPLSAERRMTGKLRWRWAIASLTGLVSAVMIIALVLLHRHVGDPAKLAPTQIAASGQSTSQAQNGIRPPAPSAEIPAESNAKGVLSARAATAPKSPFHPRSGSIAANSQAQPNTLVAASASKALTTPAAPPDSGALQTGAEIAGSVIDPSGAAISGAKVSLRLPDATTRQTTTDSAGNFAISVPPGNYKVEFNAAGFQTAAQDIDIHAQDRAALSETLTPGSASETVNVSAASATQLQTENAELHGTINGKAVDPLLLNGRNFTQLSPGVSNQPIHVPAGTGAPMASGVSGGLARYGAGLSIKDGSVQSCVGTTCTARVLPSGAKAISVVSGDHTTLVLDANGNLFSSKDMGKHWVGTKPQWQGKAAVVQLAPPPSGSIGQSIGGPVASGPTAGIQAAPPVFELTNDQGQVWLSSDEGQTWHLK